MQYHPVVLRLFNHEKQIMQYSSEVGPCVHVSMLLRQFTSFTAMPLYIASQIQPVREGTRMQKGNLPDVSKKSQV